MPKPTPFHERLLARNEAYAWKEWSGYYAPCRFDTNHSSAYTAFRRSAGLLDVTPLFKYEVRGKDAARFLSFVTARDVTKMKLDRVTYACWCDERGKIIDDGTITRLADDLCLITAAEPTWRWLDHLSRGFDVSIEDVSDQIATLALQGPRSRDISQGVHERRPTSTSSRSSAARRRRFEAFPFASHAPATREISAMQVWVENAKALSVFDSISDAGKSYAMRLCGLDALDMVRVEAGFILLGVDYFSAPHCVLETRRSTPFEVGLGWTVQLDREPFMGSEALAAEKARGPKWEMVGIETDWEDLEHIFNEYHLPPALPAQASRAAVPLYVDGKQGRPGPPATRGRR